MKKKLALQCLDIHGNTWTHEFITIFNWWHIVLFNWCGITPAQGNVYDTPFKPKSFIWRFV